MRPEQHPRSHTANCAREGMFRPESKRAFKDIWINGHRLFLCHVTAPGGGAERVCTPTIISRHPLRLGLMDAVTGSIYDRTGRCLSSDVLRMTSKREAQREGGRILRAIKIDKW